MSTGGLLRLNDVEIDLDAGELRRAGAPVAVEPQVFALIAYLAARPGALVSRDELIDAIWDGRIVSDSAIASRINAARSALDDDGKAQRIIKTVPRRGFRFVGAVGEERRTRPSLPDKPSIAVLPFENMSDDPEQAFFSDGITDDIITELARYDELFVIARYSSFAFRGATDLSAAARELGVQYLLGGGVRRAGDRVRVTANLTDAIEGVHVWGERYDRELEDIFAVQDEITAVIVNTLVGEVTRRHYRRSLARGSNAATAYEHALRAMQLVQVNSPDNVATALREAEAAAAADSGFARAHALVAWALVSSGQNGWTDDPEASFRMAVEAARTAVATDPREPWAHCALGFSEILANRAHDRGLAALARALALNPGNAHFHSMMAWGLVYAGRSAEAVDELGIAMRLNPHSPPLYFVFLGRALFQLRRFDEALPNLERHVADAPDHANGWAMLAACCGALGRTEDAAAAVAAIGRLSPGYSLTYVRGAMPYARGEDLALYVEMLRRAGLPE